MYVCAFESMLMAIGIHRHYTYYTYRVDVK